MAFVADGQLHHIDVEFTYKNLIWTRRAQTRGHARVAYGRNILKQQGILPHRPCDRDLRLVFRMQHDQRAYLAVNMQA